MHCLGHFLKNLLLHTLILLILGGGLLWYLRKPGSDGGYWSLQYIRPEANNTVQMTRCLSPSHQAFDLNLSGEAWVDVSNNHLLIDANNGRLRLSPSGAPNAISWYCHASSQPLEDEELPFHLNLIQHGSEHVLDLSDLEGVECHIALPEGLDTRVVAQDMQVMLIKPNGPRNIFLQHGTVCINPDPHMAYHYDLKVHEGFMDYFESTSSGPSQGKPIHVVVKRGKILQKS